MITQYISPWVNGERTTLQFFDHLRQLWIVQRDNSGAVISKCEHELGDAYESTLAAADKIGCEKNQQEVA
jgi:hypothetical protein